MSVTISWRVKLDKSEIQIRIATMSDLVDIQSCARAAYSKYVERIGQEPAPMVADFASQIHLGQIHVALCNNSFSGYAVFYPEGDHLHLENVAVLPSFAGRGIGRKLIEHTEETARLKRLSAVELYTNEKMFENLSMYPKLGYMEIDRKRETGFNRVYFRKVI